MRHRRVNHDLTAPPRLPVPDAHLPRRERRFPFRPVDDVEALDIRAEFNRIASHFDNMIWQAIRHKIHRPDLADECYASVLWRLWRSALPHYDAKRAGLGTVLFVAIRNAVTDFVRRLRPPRELRFDGSEFRAIAPDTRLDHRIENAATQILSHPDQYASPREAQVIADVRDHPHSLPTERGQRLGMTSRRVNTVMGLARERIRRIDVDEIPMAKSAGA